MLTLIGITAATSFLDSLNPSAIAQQILLQAQVAKKRHVLFFILGIGLANVCLGLAVYYGVMAHLARAWAALSGLVLFRAALAATGLLCAGAGVLKLARLRRAAGGSEAEMPRAKALGPWGLFWLGVTFCAVELTSALPYFGFLAILAGYGLPPVGVLAFVAAYSLVYAAPLILIYAAYNRFQKTGLVSRFEAVVGRISRYILPIALVAVGVLLVVQAA